MSKLEISTLTAIRDLRGMRKLQGVYTDAIDTAIAALEKQVKKQPRQDETIGMAVCPRCGWPIDEHEGFQAYCEICGQHLKWEDEKMKSAYQIITHIDEVIQNAMPDTAGHAVIVAMTDLIDWIGDREPVAQEARRGDDGVYKSHCPKCGHATESGRGFNFCPYCGQKYGRGFLDD